MGVSGSGKSTIGRRLANSLDAAFIDADDLHSAANVAKMASGTPLTDEDRWGWLTEVGRLLNQSANAGVVIACSALRRAYRSVITAEAPQAIFVELDGSRPLLASLVRNRTGHFMPATLLDSQLAILEPLEADEPGIRLSLDALADPETIELAALEFIHLQFGSHHHPSA
jgi:gluconokinase